MADRRLEGFMLMAAFGIGNKSIGLAVSLFTASSPVVSEIWLKDEETRDISVGLITGASTLYNRNTSEGFVRPKAFFLFIGIFNQHGNIPKERLVSLSVLTDLFKTIRSTSSRLRALREFGPLKDIVAFGLYEVSMQGGFPYSDWSTFYKIFPVPCRRWVTHSV